MYTWLISGRILLGTAFETFESPFVQDLFAGQRDWVGADGTVAVPSAPGLGVEFDEETCSRYCVATDTVSPRP